MSVTIHGPNDTLQAENILLSDKCDTLKAENEKLAARIEACNKDGDSLAAQNAGLRVLILEHGEHALTCDADCRPVPCTCWIVDAQTNLSPLVEYMRAAVARCETWDRWRESNSGVDYDVMVVAEDEYEAARAKVQR